MNTATTQAELARDLRQLGVEPGDTLFVHSSFRSLRPVDGGAAAVVGALEDVVGPEGLILMPSFNLGKAPDGGDTSAYRAGRWNLQTAVSTVGYLTEFFRQMPGTFRSDHYSHSVAARGNGAEEFVSGHLEQDGLDSPWDLPAWGKTYGTHSPMVRAYELEGKVLMIGTDHSTCTYCHVVELFFWHHRREKDPKAMYVYLDRVLLGKKWDETRYMRIGRVGRADCRHFPIREYVDTLLSWVIEDPHRWVRTSAKSLFAPR